MFTEQVNMGFIFLMLAQVNVMRPQKFLRHVKLTGIKTQQSRVILYSDELHSQDNLDLDDYYQLSFRATALLYVQCVHMMTAVEILEMALLSTER